jgi:hypothetical protein
MDWFDQDFPGHYQRLIRQVHVSVVALVPPNRGIRATLASSGISRVTTGNNGSFSDVILRRDPDAIALTSPLSATGVFQVDLQPDMLLPFEGSGVCTSWDFIMPLAANPFDFSSISDVLITIDYTALSDVGYRTQVVAALNGDLTRRSDCVFSLARDFPDQWYQLVNSDPSATGRTATITLTTSNFPPNIGSDGLQVAQVAMQLAGGSDVGQIPITLIHGSTSGTALTDAQGVVSTRRGAGAWNVLVGGSPLGTWVVSLDPSADPSFQSGAITDVVLIVSWSGQGEAWPT